MARILGFFSEKSTDTGTDLTTKGDIHGFSTSNTRIPIGSNNQVLTADSTEALGLKWATLSSGITATAETSVNYSDDYSGSSQAVGNNAILYGQGIDSDMPAGDYKFIRATALECKIGSTASGNFKLALWIRSATRGYLSCLAWTPQTAQSSFGTNTVAKIQTVGSAIITPSAITNEDIMISYIQSASDGTVFTNGGTGVGNALTYSTDTELTSSVDMSNSFSQPELKVYWECYK